VRADPVGAPAVQSAIVQVGDAAVVRTSRRGRTLLCDRDQAPVVAWRLAVVPVRQIRADARLEQQPARRRRRPARLLNALEAVVPGAGLGRGRRRALADAVVADLFVPEQAHAVLLRELPREAR